MHVFSFLLHILCFHVTKFNQELHTKNKINSATVEACKIPNKTTIENIQITILRVRICSIYLPSIYCPFLKEIDTSDRLGGSILVTGPR